MRGLRPWSKRPKEGAAKTSTSLGSVAHGGGGARREWRGARANTYRPATHAGIPRAIHGRSPVPAGGFDHGARRPGVHRRVGAFRPSTGTAPPSSGDPAGRPRPPGGPGSASRGTAQGFGGARHQRRVWRRTGVFEPLGLYKGCGNEMMARARPTGNWLVSPSPPPRLMRIAWWSQATAAPPTSVSELLTN